MKDLLRNDQRALDIPDSRVSPEDVLIRGRFFHGVLRRGLFQHTVDGFEAHPFSLSSSQQEGLSCIFFLEGGVTARFGDRRLEIRGHQRESMGAAAVIRTREESFKRTTRAPQYVRHLVVAATPEWLDVEGLEEILAGRADQRRVWTHLATNCWTPSTHLAGLVREAFNPSAFAGGLLNLYLESRAVEIVAETLSAMLQADPNPDPSRNLSRHDRARLSRARELIASNLAEPLSVASIARAAGASPAALQRLFRRAEGQSVFEYIRRQRLDQARAALRTGTLSVQEASLLAGYTSAANFATAFKRQFGLTPREALQERLRVR